MKFRNEDALEDLPSDDYTVVVINCPKPVERAIDVVGHVSFRKGGLDRPVLFVMEEFNLSQSGKKLIEKIAIISQGQIPRSFEEW